MTKNAKPKIGAGRFPVWNALIDEFQAMDLSRQILTGKPYPIKAIFALGMNARMFPGDQKLFRALKAVDFFVDTDIFMNDTAKYADIVLPACTSLERSTFQSELGRYNNVYSVRYLSPAIKPMYESKSDADILCELAEYLKLDDPVLRRGYDACNRSVLRKVGLTLDDLKVSSAITRIPGKEPYYPGDNTAFGYRTPTGKFELTSEVLRRFGYEPLPAWVPPTEEADAEAYPLQLTSGGRLPYEFHSRFQHSRVNKLFRAGPMADLNPKDAKALHLQQGDEMWVETVHGAIRLKANLTYAIPEGAVFVYQDYEKADINSIIDSNYLDPISGFPGYRSVRCRIRKADAKEGRAV